MPWPCVEHSLSVCCRFEEMQALSRMRFNFSDKISPGRLTSALSQVLQVSVARSLSIIQATSNLRVNLATHWYFGGSLAGLKLRSCVDASFHPSHRLRFTSGVRLQRVPAKHALLALHHVPLTFDPAAIQEVLDCLTPDQARIMWSSKDFQVASPLQHCKHTPLAVQQQQTPVQICMLLLPCRLPSNQRADWVP